MLRSALSLSLVTGQPFRIEKIRAGRQKPGLLRQHLTAVLASAEISNAKVEGATLGSTTLQFAPGNVKPGDYRFAIGTAGSCTLVFQTILPALMLASASSRVTLEGGTHNTQSPPFDFLQKTFLPLLSRCGPKVTTNLERYGFYPAGGGRVTAEIQPCGKLSSIHFTERGEITHRRATAIVANLSRNIAQREVDTIAHLLGWTPDAFEIIEAKNSSGPGNVLMLELGTSAITEVFTGFGRLGVSAEKVAHEASEFARTYLASNAVAGEYLADQLLLPLALAGAGSFTTTKLSLHSRTNIEVISLFLPINFDLVKKENHFLVTVISKTG